MLSQRRRLLVEVSSIGARGYLFSVLYGVGKAAQDRLAKDMAHELRPHGIASVSFWPPLFVGCTVAALAADPNVLAKSGQVLTCAALAEESDPVDEDGTRLPLPAGGHA